MFKTDITALLAGSALALSVAASPAVAAIDFSNWDSDSNGSLSKQEFNSGFDNAQVFSAWDDDGDGKLSREEFEAAAADNQDKMQERFGDTDVYAIWDTDADGEVSEREFKESAWGGLRSRRRQHHRGAGTRRSW
ncbi:hypothetical protein QW131_24895 [Roseibium salinum]|nr:hypothetical protein [Roseibium salinum]